MPFSCTDWNIASLLYVVITVANGILVSTYRDVAYAFRGFARNPGLVIAVVISISVGIAANTTVFSIVNAVMFGALPVSEPDRLVTLDGGSSLSYPDYVSYRDGTEVFKDVSGRMPIVPVSLGGGEAERIWGQMVTGNYFDVLGLQPAHGRDFLPEEYDAPGRSAVTILSNDLWQRRYGGDPAILGRTVIFNNSPFTVIGITPPGFHGEDRALVSEFWSPVTMVDSLLPDIAEMGPWDQRETTWLSLTARLKDGVSRQQAQAAVNVVKDRIDAEHNPEQVGKAPMTLSAAGGLIGGGQTAVAGLLAVLAAVVAFVLLIACANVANILLARATGRQREISIRIAMGATCRRLICQLLTESILLAALGAVAGVSLAWLATQALSGLRLPISLPFQMDFRLDLRVLAWTGGLTGLTGVLVGILPALRATRPDLVSGLKDEAGNLGAFRRFGLRQILVVGQVSLSILLLVSAGLFLRGLQSASSVNLGFNADNLLLLSFDLKSHGYSLERSRYLVQQLQQRVSSLPNVESASITDLVPLSLAARGRRFKVSGPPGEPPVEIRAEGFGVGASYFETIGSRIVRGRSFDPHSDLNANVVLLNAKAAETAFPNGDAIGKIVQMDGLDFEIIGITENAKCRTLGENTRSALYTFWDRDPSKSISIFGLTLLTKTRGEPQTMTNAVRNELRSLDPNLAVFGIETMREHVNKALLLPRISAILLGIFGLAGLALASVGLYGVMSYSVRRRTKEIGIRMAIGADSREVLRGVLRQGLLMAVTGVAIGLLAAAGAGRLYLAFLHGVSPMDPVVFLTVPLVLLVVAVAASLVPALRASRVSPSVALRYE